MTSTLELLEKAISKRKAAEWCKAYNTDPSTFSQAKRRGRLSPTLAANLAIDLGADPIFWTAVAAAEAEPESPLKDRMRALLERAKSTI